MAGVNLVLFFFCSWTVAVIGIIVLLNDNENDAPSFRKVVGVASIVTGVVALLGLHFVI